MEAFTSWHAARMTSTCLSLGGRLDCTVRDAKGSALFASFKFFSIVFTFMHTNSSTGLPEAAQQKLMYVFLRLSARISVVSWATSGRRSPNYYRVERRSASGTTGTRPSVKKMYTAHVAPGSARRTPPSSSWSSGMARIAGR